MKQQLIRLILFLRYQQYSANSSKNLPDRDCMVQQEYEVDVEETYEPEKVSYFLTSLNWVFLAHLSTKCSWWAIVVSQCPSSVVRRQQLL